MGTCHPCISTSPVEEGFPPHSLTTRGPEWEGWVGDRMALGPMLVSLRKKTLWQM